MLGRESGGADYFETALFHFCFQFQKSIVEFAASVCSDKSSGGIISADVIKVFHKCGRNTPVVDRDSEEGKII